MDQSTIDKLNLDDTSVHLYAITIDQLTNSSDSKGLNGYVLLLRPDCKGCQTSVPSIMVFESGNFISLEVGISSKGQLSSILK